MRLAIEETRPPNQIGSKIEHLEQTFILIATEIKRDAGALAATPGSPAADVAVGGARILPSH